LNGLLQEIYPSVFALCRRMMNNPEDALDLTQDALIAVVKGLPGFHGDADLRTWVYRVTTNTCVDEIRRRARRPVLVDSPAEGPANEIDSAGRIDIDDALKGLALEFRAAVVLRDVMDMDYAEIAEVLDVPIGTVRSRIARGRRSLAKSLNLGNQSSASDVKGGE
jgi:RNA polymerase sigma-70 factor (ECF subfamily)